MTSELRRRTTLARLCQLLPGLYYFVRREVAYREAVADVPPGAVQPDEVVDRVLMAAYQELIPAADDGEISTIVRRLTVQQINQQIRNGNGMAPGIETAESAARASSGYGNALPGCVLYFFEAESDAETTADPEQATSQPEHARDGDLREALEQACSGMPRAWRRAMLLRHVNALSGEALARAVGRPEEEVSRMVEHARAYLREQLLDARASGRSRAWDIGAIVRRR
jgi:DNA-directed RNA polymerase specialized sigma24 family protein